MLWLIALTLFTRLPQIIKGAIPFSFDHGRDSLAVLHLIKTLNPVFIGPWTSIPGLFFGPGWYYLLAPAYFISQGNPLAGPITMLLLTLVGIVLAYKYLGIFEAIMITTAPLWLQLSTGAANPFPMAFVGLVLIIGLKRRVKPLMTGLILGLGFHFSSALSIFWLALVPFFFKLKQWPKLALGVLIAFIPQLLFELKHNFSQTKAVINYFAAGESQRINPGKIAIVTKSVVNELSLAILPDALILKIIGIVILFLGLIYFIAKNKPDRWFWQLLLMIIVPTVGFWFLHYNPWYAYGLTPLAVVIAGKILRRLPKPVAWLYCLLLLVGLVFRKNPDLATYKAMLPAKMTAINYVYEKSAGAPFASYHYLPEIYDFAYQYLYIWQAFKGKPLPVEFSYQPGALTYIPEKVDLLALLRQGSGGQAKLIFLIIEKPDNVWHYPFESWLKQIKFSQVVDKKIIGPELEVWQVAP